MPGIESKKIPSNSDSQSGLNERSMDGAINGPAMISERKILCIIVMSFERYCISALITSNIKPSRSLFRVEQLFTPPKGSQ